MPDAVLALILVFASFLVALAALLAFSIIARRQRRKLADIREPAPEKAIFLFEDGTLVDATRPARRIINAAPPDDSDWARLVSLLAQRFRGMEQLPDMALEKGSASLPAQTGTSRLSARVVRGMLRLEIIDSDQQKGHAGLDKETQIALFQELDTHRQAARNVPVLIWRENEEGEVTWANRAYLDTTRMIAPDAAPTAWPPARLFNRLPPPGEDGEEQVRASIPSESGNGRKWFEIHRKKLDDGTLMTAIPIDALVQAEASLSEFISTLTATFAHLPIGLAVFDAERKLSLFNPALTDLTQLPATFLCGQPSLFSFLDRLREKRMVPEPKDYKSWRQEMADLEKKAVDGAYCETWFLPTGQTYRVVGQPHPGGAIAFLFEDISSEVSMTHRFHAEVEIGQAALDGLDQAIAIFTAGGTLAMANRAYDELWGGKPTSSVSEITISDATFAWREHCNPTPVWRQLREFVAKSGNREKWQAGITLKDGRVLTCTVTPMVQGATMVTFTPALSVGHDREQGVITAHASSP